MLIADDEPHTAHARGHQTLQKSSPVNFCPTQRYGYAQDCAFAFQVHTASHQDGHIPDLTIHAHLLIPGVQVQVEDDPKRSVAPALHHFIQLG